MAAKLAVDLQQLIGRYCRYHQSVLTIEQFTQFGRNAQPQKSYKFLRNEVPIRLAHIIQEISHLPKNLQATPSVELVKSWYVQSFVDLLEFEKSPVSDSTLERFSTTLLNVKRRHNNTVETMAQGVMELREREGASAIIPAVQYFLDRFFMSRIGIRLLMAQHLALFKGDLYKNFKSRFIGVFEPQLDPRIVVHDAIENSRLLCDQYYFASPDVDIKVVDAHNNGRMLAYVPSHLYFMLFELLKNAMRATMETHGSKDTLPPIEVDIVRGEEDLTIKVQDNGGGIPRSQMAFLFAYHYSTAPEPDREQTIAPLAGYGYGLPLTRLYARYFGGDIQISSVEGLGTAAHIYLKALSQHAQEVIPMYNSAVAKKYTSDHFDASSSERDWSNSSFYQDYMQPQICPTNGEKKSP